MRVVKLNLKIENIMKTKKLNIPKSILNLIYLLLLFNLAACDNDNSNATKTQPQIDIHMAVISNDIESVNQYILSGSDIDKKDPFGGSSPLISAVIFDKKEIAKILIQAGADLNFRNNDGSTPLLNAAFFGRVDIVQLLLNKGADKTIKNNTGATAYQSVVGDFNEIKPIYDMVSQSLAPMGLKLDYQQLKSNRPIIAAILK